MVNLNFKFNPQYKLKRFRFICWRSSYFRNL